MPDVFDVLLKDHEEVKQMLEELQQHQTGADGGGQLARLKKMADKLIAEESKHEAVEEMFFWPAVRDKLDNGDELADQATAQEQQAKQMLSKLDKLDAGDPKFAKLLREFTEDAREHIDFEQTQVWPRMREALSKKEASDIGRKLQEGKKTAPSRPGGDAAKGRGAGRGSRRRGSDGSAEGKTKAELYEQARKLGVQGRSSMSKDELARHVAQAAKKLAGQGTFRDCPVNAVAAETIKFFGDPRRGGT